MEDMRKRESNKCFYLYWAQRGDIFGSNTIYI